MVCFFRRETLVKKKSAKQRAILALKRIARDLPEGVHPDIIRMAEKSIKKHDKLLRLLAKSDI